MQTLYIVWTALRHVRTSRRPAQRTPMMPFGAPRHRPLPQALFVAKIKPTLPRIVQLREELAVLLRHAAHRNQLVAGGTVSRWARELGFSTQQYIHQMAAAPHKDGNSILLDGCVLALLLGTSIWIEDENGLPSMRSHGAPSWALIRHWGN
eukprot:5756092-Amphidinium_carterae.1